MNQITTILMNQVKAKNPQAFRRIEQLMQNQSNPIEIFKQVTNGYSNEQMNNFYNQARNMGFSDDLINQLKNGVDTQK